MQPTFRPLRRFGGDDQGAIALIFALMVVVIIFIVGVSIDTGRAMRASTLASNALDAAALAGAKGMVEDELDDAEINERVTSNLLAQFDGAGLQDVSWSGLQVSADRQKGTVSIAIDMHVPATFTRLFNYETIDVHRSVKTAYKIKAVELAMALDVTGSMNDDDKLDDMKDAAIEAVKVLLPANKKTLNRVALAPFSATVNAGALAADVSDGRSLDGCVIERDGAEAATDTAPVGANALLVEADARAADTSVPPQVWWVCPDAVVLPLEKNRQTLQQAIQDFGADGGTAGHLGIAWAYYLLSPNWNAIWPAASHPKPFNDGGTIKAAIVMTDGMFNTSYFNGPMMQTSPVQAQAVCDEMKARGIIVYTIGFAIANQPPPADQQSRDLLSSCASGDGNGGTLFFEAVDGDALKATFKEIAGKLQALRLTN